MESKEKRPEGSKPKKPSVFGLLKTYKNKVLVLLFVALFSNAINLVIPKIISHGIDDFTAGKLVFENILLEFFVAALVIFIFSYLQSVLQTLVAELVARNLRTEVSAKISQQSYTFVQKMNPAKLLTNLTSDIDSVKAFGADVVAALCERLIAGGAPSLHFYTLNLAKPAAVEKRDDRQHRHRIHMARPHRYTSLGRSPSHGIRTLTHAGVGSQL